MLDPWIIEEIRRREEDRRRNERAPAVIEMPVHNPDNQRREEGKPEEGPRGVTVIDFGVD